MVENGLLTRLIDTVRSAGKVAPTALVSPESRLVEDLGIDSLDLVAVFLEIQDRFDVVIDDDDVPGLKCLADVAAYVTQRKGSIAA